MSKHTPGPWHQVNGYSIFSDLGADSGDGYKAPGNDGWMIATAETGSVINADGDFITLSHSVVRANARLIAKAPELLSLLEEARSTLEMWKDVAPAVSLCADIDKAIAEALGEKDE